MPFPCNDLWDRRYLLFALVGVDLRARYRRSVFGLGWCLLNPVAMALILAGVFHSVFAANIATFIPFLLVGLAFWSYLSTVALQGCQCYFQGQPYLRQCPTPLSLFPLRTALANTVQLGCTLGVATVLAGFVAHLPAPLALLSLAPAVILITLFGWAVAALCGVATVWLQDAEHLFQIGLQLLFYMTPILYPPGTIRAPAVAWVVDRNPLVPFLELLREPILNGHPASPDVFLRAGVVAAVAGLLASAVLRLVRHALVFRL